jgi:(p)ppGpp synthase/HD superfamily hydrolase
MMDEVNQSFEDWCVYKHASTNHFYDKKLGLPYKFHLTMAELAGLEFKRLLEIDPPKRFVNFDIWKDIVKPAIWGHDVIEDARASYNDVLKLSNKHVAEIVRAVSNDSRGRTRAERMPDYIYEEIATTPFATFVKLCDRIANIRYSWMMQSGMFNTYKEEHTHFKEMLDRDPILQPMWALLDSLLLPKLTL